MSGVIKIVDSIIAKTMAFLMALLVASVSWQVISRYIIGQPSSITEELARFTLVWLGVLGSAYAYSTRQHLGLDMLVNKLSSRDQAILRIMADSFVLFTVVIIFIIGGGGLVELTSRLTQLSAALKLPIAMVYAILPISGALFVLYSSHFIYQQYLQLQRGEHK